MKKFLLLLTVVVILSSVTAHAKVYICQSHLLSVSLAPNGLVAVTMHGSFEAVYVCQIGATFNGVSPEVCKVIYQTLLDALFRGRSVEWWFDDNLSCWEHPAWSPLTGWYYGPQVR